MGRKTLKTQHRIDLSCTGMLGLLRVQCFFGTVGGLHGGGEV